MGFWQTLIFKDSLAFLNGSLSKLVDNLYAKGEENFKALANVFPDPLKRQFLFRKQPFPYTFITGMESFNFPGLPEKQHFRNNLNEADISEEHAQKVFKEFACQSFRHFHDLYLILDTILLPDIFPSFRYMIMDYYGLEATSYYTLPALTFSAGLKMTQVKLEIMKDANMFSLVRKGLRGGIVSIVKRHQKADNHYMEDFNPSLPISYIFNLDFNALYSEAMTRTLFYGDQRWLTEEETKNLDIMSHDDDDPIGYIMMVDLFIPE